MWDYNKIIESKSLKCGKYKGGYFMNTKLKRISMGLTQTDLSKKSNVGMNTIVKIEKGDIDSIKVGTLKKIAAALNANIEELFFR